MRFKPLTTGLGGVSVLLAAFGLWQIGHAIPKCSFSPGSIDLGELPAGKSVERTLTLHNWTLEPMQVEFQPACACGHVTASAMGTNLPPFGVLGVVAEINTLGLAPGRHDAMLQMVVGHGQRHYAVRSYVAMTVVKHAISQ